MTDSPFATDSDEVVQPNPPKISLRECFAFPVRTPEGRRDILIGGTLLLLPLVGWILNLGHRLGVVHRLHHDQQPIFHGFSPYGRTFVQGLKAASAIVIYLLPSVLLATLSYRLYLAGISQLAALSASLCFLAFALGIFSLPGGMTYNAVYGDISYLYRPDRAFARARAGGRAYLHAWMITLAAICVSSIGILGLGVGFLYASVWAWSVVGYAFSRALSLKV